MTNVERVNDFLDLLLGAPEHTMSAVRMRLSLTDYELVLKKADILKPFVKEWDRQRDLEAANAFSLSRELPLWAVND